MKRTIKFLAILLTSVTILSCGNATTEQTDELTSDENTEIKKAAELKTDGITIVATFVDANSFEGDETYIFNTEDGKKIEFNRVLGNAEVTEEPLEYAFFDYENLMVNKEFIGQSFEINYRVEADCYNVEGNKVDCNKINSIKKLN